MAPISVRHEVLIGMRLGVLRVRRVLDSVASRGIGQVYGDVLRDNRAMLKLCSVLGFSQEGVLGEPEIVRVILGVGG